VGAAIAASPIRQFQQAGLAVEVDLAMDDLDLTSSISMTLRTLSVQVAIDDFGTGHSSPPHRISASCAAPGPAEPGSPGPGRTIARWTTADE